MKRIIFISYFYEPDLSAGSFRNTALSQELARLAQPQDVQIEVYTSTPNRYESFQASVTESEAKQPWNLIVHRIDTVQVWHGKLRLIIAFIHYFLRVLWMNRWKKADLVFTSSSKFFSTLLGYTLSKWKGVPLYLDVRDLFALNLQEIQLSRTVRHIVSPVLFWMERVAFKHAIHINVVSGGFNEYIRAHSSATMSEFTNGIDDMFLQQSDPHPKDSLSPKPVKTIMYAGNIGEGQGLHKIIPEVASQLGSSIRFLIYGDGAMANELHTRIAEQGLTNVEVRKPIVRNLLLEEYQRADYLFLHLNDYDSFKKVLPSKVFELSTFGKPILAGVAGYPAKFIRDNIPGSYVFNPCDASAMIQGIRSFDSVPWIDRKEFIEKYSRSRITLEMSKSILSYC